MVNTYFKHDTTLLYQTQYHHRNTHTISREKDTTAIVFFYNKAHIQYDDITTRADRKTCIVRLQAKLGMNMNFISFL